MFRILHVIDSLDLGGAQEALVNLVALRDRSRFEAEVACLHRPGVYTGRVARLGVPVHSLSPHKFLPLYIPRLLRLLARRPFHIVHCHLIASNLIAKPLARLAGVPVIFNHDQTNDSYRLRQPLRLHADALANHFCTTHTCAVSASTREFLTLHEGLHPDDVSLVHNGIDLARFAPPDPHDAPAARLAARARFGIPPEATLVAGIGRLNYQKNFALLLDVAATVLPRFPALRFVLAGSGPEESALRAKAAALGISDKIHFLGYVPDTAALYPALDLLFMPSRFEGLPMTLLEAMSMGLPALASRLDGISEILVDGSDGALEESGDTPAFAARLTRLLESPADLTQMARLAQIKVRQNFSAEGMTRKVESLYLRFLPPQPSSLNLQPSTFSAAAGSSK